MEYSSNLMVAVLRKEYPEIASIITEKIKETLPGERLDDLSNIEKIVETFKRERKVTVESWTTNSTGKRSKIIYERDLLIGVILLFYDPEKIMQLVRRQTTNGVMKEAAGLLGTSRETLCASTPNVIVAFRAYADFREEVYRLYELIKIENKFFE